MGETLFKPNLNHKGILPKLKFGMTIASMRNKVELWRKVGGAAVAVSSQFQNIPYRETVMPFFRGATIFFWLNSFVFLVWI